MNYPKNRYRGPHPWTDKEWLYNEYMVKKRAVEDIAAEFGCAPATIQKAASKHNLHREPLPKQSRQPLKPYEDPETLHRLYHEEGKNFTQMGEILGCSPDTIRVRMQKYNIPFQEHPVGKLKDVDLYTLYVIEKKSTTQIGEMFGVTARTVGKTLAKKGIPVRSLSESHYASLGIERNPLLEDKEWLYEEYITKRRGAAEIGEELGHSLRVVQDALKQHGIPVRGSSESKIGLMTGENHPNWKGGVTDFHLLCREYYQINLRPQISERDNYTCTKCGKTHCVLHVHHIIPLSYIIPQIMREYPDIDMSTTSGQSEMYDKVIHDVRFTNPNNMITLCRECHIKEHQKYSLRNQKEKMMKIKTYLEESFDYYKEPVMLIASPTCTFKCCRESGLPVCVCQNSEWASQPTYEVPISMLIQMYLSNPIAHAVVFGGLEPLDSFDDVLEFIQEFRQVSQDEIVIYTGYVPEEVIDKINKLKEYNNIVLKFGRYIPSRPSRYDEVLGITLASDNQYGEKIS